MSGNLYQLKTTAPVGGQVLIGGPSDTYGILMARQESGYHLIRGTGHAKPSSGTIYNTETE